MKIAVTGGKGGTGKSFFAVNLAHAFLKLGKKVTYVDCDADCPSAHLLLNLELESKESTMSFIPKVDKEKCIKCGKCVRSCEYNSLYQLENQPPMLLPLICSGCKTCKIVCPVGAIKDDEKLIGYTYQTKKENLELFSGELKPSDPLSEKVVNSIKERAEKNGTGEIFIYDTAAGAHCPVVAALEGCEKAIVVTEPTVFGEHDLKIIIEVLNKLKIPFEKILNRSTISNKKSDEFKMEIPYSEKILECYVNGTPIVEKYPEDEISKSFIKFAKELIE